MWIVRKRKLDLFAPVAGVAEVAVNRAGGDFGDEGQAPLILGGLDPVDDHSRKPLVQISLRSLDPLQREVDPLEIKSLRVEASAHPFQQFIVLFMLWVPN